MKSCVGCLIVLIALPMLAVVGYFLSNIFLYFLPLLVVAAIILALPYLVYHFWKGFKG